MGLMDFFTNYVQRDECKCGRCIDVGSKSDLTKHTADMIFFNVCLKNDPSAQVLRKILANNDNLFKLFDGEEHSYLEVGAWVGDQGLALMLMGAGSLLGLWTLMTPRTMLPGLDDDIIMAMAGNGMVSIKENNEKIT